MLLMAGVTRVAGSVDDGDTVTDHLDQERERGITIQAAAVSFAWHAHTLNLLDTPGHVDFTIEVERATRVLDGAALIVDAVSGAQAQTVKVWRQARVHGVSAVAFVNKMDREGADYAAAIGSLEARLGLTVLSVQLPLPGISGATTSSNTIDLVDSALPTYFGDGSSSSSTGGGAPRLRLERTPLVETVDGIALTGSAQPRIKNGADSPLTRLSLEAQAARATLVERVAELEVDGPVAELYLGELPVPPHELRTAIRRLTMAGVAVPALCGVAIRGIGVEQLLDAICAYLPSPADRPPPALGLPPASSSTRRAPADCSNEYVHGAAQTWDQSNGSSGKEVKVSAAAEAVALAFKVVHDTRTRKPVVWLRVYSGFLSASNVVRNSRTGVNERIMALHTLAGEQTIELYEAGPGAICAATGPRSTRTGDTLLLRPNAGCYELLLPPLAAPAPVFYIAVETGSKSQQGALEAAINALCLEDPNNWSAAAGRHGRAALADRCRKIAARVQC
jgi:elongation factor G